MVTRLQSRLRWEGGDHGVWVLLVPVSAPSRPLAVPTRHHQAQARPPRYRCSATSVINRSVHKQTLRAPRNRDGYFRPRLAQGNASLPRPTRYDPPHRALLCQALGVLRQQAHAHEPDPVI